MDTVLGLVIAILVVAWFMVALLGAYVSTEKGRSGFEGFFLGLVFGFFGVIIAALLPTRRPS